MSLDHPQAKRICGGIRGNSNIKKFNSNASGNRWAEGALVF
jgi:hypothetical protein